MYYINNLNEVESYRENKVQKYAYVYVALEIELNKNNPNCIITKWIL